MGHGEALVATGLQKDCTAYVQHALGLARSALEPTDPVLADLALTLARAIVQGDVADDPLAAIELAREAITLREQILPAEHWRIGEAQVVLGQSLMSVGAYPEANEALFEGHAILQAALGAHHFRTQRASDSLARLHEPFSPASP